MISPIFVVMFGVGLCMVVFGIDQLRRPSNWFDYIPQLVSNILPLKKDTTMRLHALGNIIFGLFLIFPIGHPLLAAWIAFIWWLTILPFAFRYDWKIGMRDLSITLAVLALILLIG